MHTRTDTGRHPASFSPVRLLPFIMMLVFLSVGANTGFATMIPILDPVKLGGYIGKGFSDVIPKTEKWGESALPVFGNKDRDMDPGYNPDGMPEAPLGCAGSAECRSCYEEAHRELLKLRYSFAKLLILYNQTDNLVKDSYSFGDSIAGMTGYGALAWYEERSRIARSWKEFEKAYRNKYQELLERLENNLKVIAQCEAQYFGDQDWYSRYGFMFLTFVAMHYKK
jgi:hypothetical protein